MTDIKNSRPKANKMKLYIEKYHRTGGDSIYVYII